VNWVRQYLDRAGRVAQWVLVLVDGSFDTLSFGGGLPERVVLAAPFHAHFRIMERLGLAQRPPVLTRWWQSAKRWSFNTLWPKDPAALWGLPQFQALWTRLPDHWLKMKPSWLACPILLHLIPESKPKRALAHPFRFPFLISTLL